jgi:hypothetical protein
LVIHCLQDEQESLFSLRLEPTAFTTPSSSETAVLTTPVKTKYTTAPADDATASSSSSSSSHAPVFSAVTTWQRLAQHLEPTSSSTATTATTVIGAIAADATATGTATTARKRSVEHMYDEQAVFDEGYEVLPHERQRANSLSTIQVSLLYLQLHLFMACSTVAAVVICGRVSSCARSRLLYVQHA